MNLEVITCEPERPAHPAPILFVHGMWHAAWCWAENFLPYFAQNGYRASALSLRAGEKKIVFLSEFPSDGKSKKAFETLTKGLKLGNALVVDEKKNEKLHRAVRNMDKFDVLPVEGVNVESVLRRETLVITVAAAKALNEALTKPRGSKAGN